MAVNPVQYPQQSDRFPFDAEFQKTLLRLLCEDDGLAHALGRHLQPWYFENEALAWAYSYCQRHVEEYGAMPSLGVILQKTRTMDPRVGPVYSMTIEEVIRAPLRDEQWLRDNVLDFVKRNIFARTFAETRELYNSGKVDQAYDLMMQRMEELHATTWEQADRGWIAEEYGVREVRRGREDPSENSVPTGFNWLDHILQGGLSKGELGLWIAYSKIGKTTMLVQHGKAAVRNSFIPTAHFVFEGSRRQVENRYDASFSGELYNKVKLGDTTSELYHKAFRNYQLLRGLLVVSGFTERWDYSVVDIHEELKTLRRAYGFIPKLVIVDYGDLLTGREKRYRNEYERQKAAFRDLKSLANRGYALWTASQAQRPEKGADVKADFVKSRQIADAYEKIRVSDFIGSLNQTLDEKDAKVMRLYAELYRDNAADRWLPVEADLDRMTIKQTDGIVSPSMTGTDPALGWAPPTQMHAPI
jgi:replicative DNA helicase